MELFGLRPSGFTDSGDCGRTVTLDPKGFRETCAQNIYIYIYYMAGLGFGTHRFCRDYGLLDLHGFGSRTCASGLRI